MLNTQNESTPPGKLLSYIDGNPGQAEITARRRSVFTRSEQGPWILVICVVHAFPDPARRPEAAVSHRYDCVMLLEDWLDRTQARAFVDDIHRGAITIGDIIVEHPGHPVWQTELVASQNSFMRGVGLVVRTRFEERTPDMSQQLLISSTEPYYPDVVSAAKDWLELVEYHGFNDARNREIIFLLPEARAYFTNVRFNNGALNLSVAGSDVGRRQLRVKGASWVGGLIRHFETKVRGSEVELSVPEDVDRLEYVLLDDEGQIFDIQREVPGSYTGLLRTRVGAIDASVPHGLIAGPEDAEGFRSLLPSAELDASPLITSSFNSPSFPSQSTDAVTSEDGVPDTWREQSGEILARLKDVEGALYSVSAVLKQIAEVSATINLAQPPAGMGHNRPPPEELLASTAIDQAIAAKELLKEEAIKTRPSPNALNLSALAFSGAESFVSWLMNQGKTFTEEAVKSAGKKFGGHAINLTAFYGSLELLRAQLPPIIDAIRAFLRIIGFLG